MSNSIVHTIRAVIAIWSVRGPRRLLAAIREKLYWHCQYVRFHVDVAKWAIVERHGKGVEAREGTLEELRRFREGRSDLPGQFYADLTHGARRFYLGFADGTLGHISWVYSDETHLHQMRLGPGEIMLEGAFTFESCRGRGLLSAVERAALNDAKLEGKHAAYTHVSVDNRASIRGVWKTGFRPVGLLSWRWILGVSVTRYLDSAAAAAAAAGLDAPAAATPAPAIATA